MEIEKKFIEKKQFIEIFMTNNGSLALVKTYFYNRNIFIYTRKNNWLE